MATFSKDKEFIQLQLAQAKETLRKLRALCDIPPNTSGNATHLVSASGSLGRAEVISVRDSPRDARRNASPYVRNGNDVRSSDFSLGTTDKAKVARENLVKVLGLQVTKMEDDLKVSLLAYFEQVEKQKEDLIDSFEIMHQQLLKHQDTWQENHRESAEKDALIHKLNASNQALQNEVQKLRQATSPNFHPHEKHPRDSDDHFFPTGNDELYENLLKENGRLREHLRQHESSDNARLERKVTLQQQLCDSYNKDISSKDVLIKRLQAENRGMQSDIETLQDELLRVNAGRISAEHEKAKVDQEMQFCEEQIRSLRDKLKDSSSEKEYLEQCIHEANGKASVCDENLSRLETEILDLQERCESYRDKVNDKERFVASVKKENQGMRKVIEALKRELALVQNEAHSLKSESERLHEEVAEREIGRLNSETNTKVSSTKIQQLKEQLYDAEMKAVELAESCTKHEKKESELNQEVLTNIEKYTKAEQELFMAKKELSQLRGFYESSENKRKEVLGDFENLRKKNNELQEQSRLKDKKVIEKQGFSDNLEDENMRLKEDKTELEEEMKSLKTEVYGLEQALQSAREHNSVQRMRLEGIETMMKRKDERIKELQDELVENHNQNDSLTDKLLQRNREMENLKISKKMLEQELELLKTGKMPLKSAHRDSSHFYLVEPATPDSGYADMDREKAIEKLSREMFSRNKELSMPSPYNEPGFNTIDEVLDEENSASERTSSPNVSELMAENEMIKRGEAELRNDVDQMGRKLAETVKENEELREKERELREALENVQKQEINEVIAADQSSQLESATGEEEWGIPPGYLEQCSTVPEEVNDYFLSVQTIPELETVPEESLIDLEDTFEAVDGKEETLQRLGDENKDLQGEIEQFEERINEYESSLENLKEENEDLSRELEHAKDNVQRVESACDEVEQERKELQQRMTDEIAKRDENISRLQEDLTSLCAKHDASEVTGSGFEEELLKARTRNLELERQCQKHRERVENVDKFLDQAEQVIGNLQAELGEAKEQTRNLENEISALKQNMSLVERDSEKIAHEKETLEQQVEENTRTQREADENLTTFFNENQELRDQLHAAHLNIRELRDQLHAAHLNIRELEETQRQLEETQEHEMEAADKNSQKALKIKQNKIEELQDELARSQQKFEELRSTWDNSCAESSDLQNELLEAKERIYEAASANDILVRRGNELEQSLFEKEELTATLKTEKQQAQKTLKERERRLQDLNEKLEQLHQAIGVLNQENQSLKEANQEGKQERIELQKLTASLEEEKKCMEEELQEAYESISDLERAFEGSEDKQTETKARLQEAEMKITSLEESVKAAEQQMQHLEKECASSADLLQRTKDSLDSSEERAGDLEAQLKRAGEKLAVLEAANDQSQGKEHMLHERLLNALNKVNEKEAECNEAKEKQHSLEVDIMKLQTRREALEKEKGMVEGTHKEVQQELESHQRDISTLRDDIYAKQMENQAIASELGRLKNSVSEAERAQQQSMEEKAKLKGEIKEALAKVSELQAVRDTNQSRIEELEDLLQRTKERVLSVEDKLKTTSKSNVDLQEKLDEVSSRFQASNDESSSFERKLKKQRELTEGLKNDLTKKEEKILSLTYEQDSAERGLQLAKMDLAKKEGKLKIQKEHLEQAQLDLEQTNRKNRETDAAHRKVCQENNRMAQEVHDLKDKIAQLENSNAHKESLVNRLESTLLEGTNKKAKPISTDDRLRDWSDKLSIAQIKLADLENELAKDIRRYELRHMRTRPLSSHSRSGTSSDGSESERRNAPKWHFTPRKENSFDSQKSDGQLLSQSDSESSDADNKRARKTTRLIDGSASMIRSVHIKADTDKEAEPVVRKIDGDLASSNDETDGSIGKERMRELVKEPTEEHLRAYSAPMKKAETESANISEANVLTWPQETEVSKEFKQGNAEIAEGLVLASNGEEQSIRKESGIRWPITEASKDQDRLNTALKQRETRPADVGEAKIPTWSRNTVASIEAGKNGGVEEYLVSLDQENPCYVYAEGMNEHVTEASEDQEQSYSGKEIENVNSEHKATDETPLEVHDVVTVSRPISDPEIEQGNSFHIFTRRIEIEPADSSLLDPPSDEMLQFDASDSSMTSVTDLAAHTSSEMDQPQMFARSSPLEFDKKSPTRKYSSESDTPRKVEVLINFEGPSNDDPHPNDVSTDVIDPFAQLMENSTLLPPDDYVDDDVMDPFTELMQYSSLAPPDYDVNDEAEDSFGNSESSWEALEGQMEEPNVQEVKESNAEVRHYSAVDSLNDEACKKDDKRYTDSFDAARDVHSLELDAVDAAERVQKSPDFEEHKVLGKERHGLGKSSNFETTKKRTVTKPEIPPKPETIGLLELQDTDRPAGLFRGPPVPKQEACRTSNVVTEEEHEVYKKPSEIRKELEEAARMQRLSEKPTFIPRPILRKKPTEATSKYGKPDRNFNSPASSKPIAKPRVKRVEKSGKRKQDTHSQQKKEEEHEDRNERESVLKLIAAFEEGKQI